MKQVTVRSNFFEADIRLSDSKAILFVHAMVRNYRKMCPTYVDHIRLDIVTHKPISIHKVEESCFLKVEVSPITKS